MPPSDGQLEIDFATSGPPDITDADLHAVLSILDSRGPRWTTAHDLLVALGCRPSENRRRWLRRIAEQSQGRIISGQLGYMLTRHATPQDIDTAARWLEHQAARMIARARDIRMIARSDYHHLAAPE